MTTKKSLLLSLFLVVAMAPVALAQVSFSVSANENNFARAQGLAEVTGTITLTNTTVGSVGGVGSGTTSTELDVYYTTGATPGTPNVNITNAQTVEITCTGSFLCPDLTTVYLNSQIGFSTGINNPTGTVLHIPVPFTTYATINSGTISIVSRLNVAGSSLNPAGGSVQGVVEAFTPVTVAQAFQLSPNPELAGVVMTVQKDPAVVPSFGYWCSTDYGLHCEASSTAYVLLCLGVVHNSQQYERYFTINVKENFTYALTSEDYEDSLDPGTTSPGVVTNGTLLQVTLNNIPTNFGISAMDESTPCSEVTAPAVPCVSLALSISGKDSYWNSALGNSGSTTFYYEVDSMDNGSAENVNIPFKFYSAGPIGTAGLPCVTLSISKGPNDVTTSIPAFNAVTEGPTLSVICFDNCISNVLFPIVLSQGPWDTDIAISNTTMDPLKTIAQNANPMNNLLYKGSATPQNGMCYMYFYSGGALAATWVTPTIAPGSVYADDLQYGNRIPALTTGYLWAFCNFSNAYGYAAIEYNFTLDSAILADYLAINVPDPEWSPRDQNGDGMGENAVTPVNITRQLQKEFAGFSSTTIY